MGNTIERYDGWKKWEPCPDCGGWKLGVTCLAGQTIFGAGVGDVSSAQDGEFMDEILVTCTNCGTDLYRWVEILDALGYSSDQ